MVEEDEVTADDVIKQVGEWQPRVDLYRLAALTMSKRHDAASITDAEQDEADIEVLLRRAERALPSDIPDNQKALTELKNLHVAVRDVLAELYVEIPGPRYKPSPQTARNAVSRSSPQPLFWIAGLSVGILGFIAFLSEPPMYYKPQAVTFFGDKSLIDVLVILGSAAGALVAGREILSRMKNSDDTLRLAHQSQREQRFANGVELLGSEEIRVRLGGIAVLKEIAEQHPDQFHVQVIEILRGFCMEQSRNAWDAFEDIEHLQRRGKIVPEERFETAYRATETDLAAAIVAIGRLRTRAANLNAERTGMSGKLELARLVLCRVKLEGCNFSGINLVDTYVSEMNFDSCGLSGSHLSLRVRKSVTFVDCDMGESRLEALSDKERRGDQITINECDCSNLRLAAGACKALINHSDVTDLDSLNDDELRVRRCWFRLERAPLAPRARLPMWIFPIRSPAIVIDRTKRGMLLYRSSLGPESR